MIAYSDLYLVEGENYTFLKRFHYFGLAQEVCADLEQTGMSFMLRLWDEKGECVGLLRRFRIPKLQTNPS